VVYRTGLPRRELDHLLELYKEDVGGITCVQQTKTKLTDYNIYTPMRLVYLRGPASDLSPDVLVVVEPIGVGKLGGSPESVPAFRST
jgi:hypothetical protein